MKGKKLLAGTLSAAMVIGTMVVPAFADDSTATVKTADELTTALANAVVKEIIIDGTIDVSTVSFEGVNGTKIKGNPSDGEDVLQFKSSTSKTTSIAFADLTMEWSNDNYKGLQHSTKLTYDNCTIKGMPFLYAVDEIFNNCTFIQESSEAYNLWTYGAKNVEFNNCTFNSAGKSVLVYNEGDVGSETVNVKDCTFNASTPVEGKAAIEIDSSLLKSTGAYNLNITGNTTATGFGTGSTSGNSLYNVKKYQVVTDDTAKKLNTEIKVDGEVVMPLSDEYMKKDEKFKNVVAQNGSKFYETLKDAVAGAKSGDTVKLLADSNGDGIIIPSRSNLTIDFGGHTYTVDGTLVGSRGTETIGFQLLKDSTIKFINGTITSKKAKMLIQNYSNLTVKDMNLELDNSEAGVQYYTLSNNNGDVVITGNTNISALDGNVAFDVCRYADYPGVSVTLDENMTGTIKGKIEVDGIKNSGEKFELIIKNGEVNGKIVPTASATDFKVAISGGSFSTDISKYCADGYKPTKVNGRWVVGKDNSTDEISLRFDRVNDRTYNIVLVSANKEIHKLNAAQFKFELVKENPADVITYEIAPVKEMALIPNGDVYELHFDGKDGVATDSGNEVKIGTVTFDGFGKFTFGATEGKVTATTGKNNLVTEFVTVAETGKGTLKISDDANKITETTISVPQHKLTINIAMNHKVTDNVTAYQDMTVEISGGNLGTNTKKYKLGTDGTPLVKLVDGVYTIKENLDENGLYTVTVKGAGYRTARYTVALTEDKTMNLWNNVMTDKTIVVDDVEAKTNFLAGDIIRDNIINIYDLSAVVAYFNADKTLTTTEYNKLAKYDLNRDGKIDMMDISIVLTSWNN